MKRLFIAVLVIAAVFCAHFQVMAADMPKLIYSSWSTFTDDFVKMIEETLGVTLEPLTGMGAMDAVAGGVPFDLYRYNLPGTYMSMVEGDAAVVLDPFIERDNFDLSGYIFDIDMQRVDGKLHGLPQNATTWLVVYNKDLFDKANVPYPDGNWTYDDFRQVCKTLHQRLRRDDIAVLTLPHWPSVMVMSGYQAGASLLDEDLTPFGEILEMFYEGYVVEGYIKSVDWWDFVNGDTAMALVRHWYPSQLYEANAPFRWDVTFTPVPEGVEFGTTFREIHQGFQIMKSTTDVEAAWKFVEWFCGPEGAKYFLSTGEPVTYMNFEGVEEIFDGSHLGENYNNVILNCKTVVAPMTPWIGEVNDIMGKYGWEAAQGNIPVKNALAMAAEEIAAVKAKYGL